MKKLYSVRLSFLFPFVAALCAIVCPRPAQGATFTVVTTNATGPGSLQQAIFDANTNAGVDTISFAITNLTLTITPGAALPAITETVTIDGATQPGFAGAPIVELNGTGAGTAVDGLKIATSNCVIRSLVINRFPGDGVEIGTNGFNTVEGCYIGLNLTGALDLGNTLNGILITNSANNVIGGLFSTNRNYIAGNTQSGINLGGIGATNNSVLGNVIGLNVTNGTIAPNSADGIRVNAPFNTIGGSASGSRNIISANTGEGIEITTLGTNSIVRGNYIGTDSGGTLDRGNSTDGLLVSARFATIGGATAGEGNLISGNNSEGIQIDGTNAVVLGNLIGTDFTGSNAIANTSHGVLINTASRSNLIGGVLAGEPNTIAFNTQDGISVAANANATNHTFRANSIFSNGDLGIDLANNGITANDPPDTDTGANNLQNFPELTSVTNTPTETIFTGSLRSRTNTTYTLDFYSNVAPNDSGNGEGQTYLGSTNLATDGTGLTNFTISLPVTTLAGRYISATATDPFGNTSEFATNVLAVSTVAGVTYTVINTNDSGPGSLRQTILDANASINAGDTVAFAITNPSTTISLASALPTLIDPVTIDGYTQPGAATNTSSTAFNGTLLVRIDRGSAASGANGLTITIGNCTVRGLIITSFAGSTGDGIELSGFGGNVIAGNFIGIDGAGTDLGNVGNGILISSSPNNVIGGASPGDHNVISGNNGDGIEITGVTATGNQVLGNLIGPNQAGTADVGNGGNGVLVNAGPNVVGGANPGQGNLISGNTANGVELNGLQATNNTVRGNRIGTDATGTTGLPNSQNGVLITTSSRSNIIGGGLTGEVLAGEANLIAFNTLDGISVTANANTNNTFRGNSIHSNGDLGIDLASSGIVANDAGDADVGANQLQNFPVLAAVTNTPTETIIVGSLNSRPSTTYTLDFYSSVAPDASGNGEGQTWLGSTNLATGADSNLTFTISLPVTTLAGRYISATATDPFGNTSEFATNVLAVSTVAGATYTVIVTNDSGPGSLRQAIIDANASINAGDTIAFAITNLSTTISLASALPTLIDPVIIDGYTQPGAATNTSTTAFNGTLLVHIDRGSAASGANGLTITIGNCTVRGLIITSFAGSTGDGIELSGFGGNVIAGNFIGIDAAGTDLGNAGNGILISSSPNNVIGGASPGERNVISGNSGDGIEITGATATGNQVLGNLIGPNQAGTVDVGNGGDGVLVGGAGANLIGGANAGEGNLISGNTSSGVELNGLQATNNLVRGNRIGTDATGASGLPNSQHGVLITTSSRSNIIGGVLAGEANRIAFNAQDGVSIAAANANTNNTIRGNSIFGNSADGIDLANNGITANDPTDTDAGANDLQNFPVLSAATNTPTEVVIAGLLQSRANTSYILDFYANVAPDASGVGEGQTWFGATNLTTDGTGLTNFLISFPVTNLAGRYIVATATDPFGNTSEFSTNVAAVSTVPGLTFTVVNTNDAGPGSLRQAIIEANAAITISDTIVFAITNLSTTIFPASALPTIIDPVTIDGYTQPGAATNTSPTAFNAAVPVVLNGISAGAGVDGLHFTFGPNTVRGLVIIRFSQDGIEFNAAGANTVAGCVIGVDLAGADLGNTANGLLLASSANNSIGGLSPGDHNVISGNDSDGIEITGLTATNNLIAGNLIGPDPAGTLDRGNGADGIFLNGAPGNLIGGPTSAARNVISGNNSEGVTLSTLSASNNTVQANFIGLDATGANLLGNSFDGILVSSAPNTTIGGAAAGQRNIISANGSDGITLTGVTATNNLIRGNRIGTDAAGTLDRGNGNNGVLISSAPGNTLGGLTAAEGNLISGNSDDGIEISGSTSSTNLVRNNLIGTDLTGTLPIANNGHGVFITSSAHDNTLGGSGNTIAFNSGDGVFVNSGNNNAIRHNLIFNNTGLGIDLAPDGVTTNDVNDVDSGANQLQNFPVLAGATNSISGVTIAGSLDSAASTSYALDFFANSLPDPSGYGEGQFYLGSTNVLTDGSGHVDFVANLPTVLAGRYVSATATDPTGNTSEFSLSVVALSTVPPTNLVVTTTNDTGSGSLREAIGLANSFISGGNDTITFALVGTGPFTLQPTNALPDIIDPVTIDGYSQSGSSTNTQCSSNNAALRVRLVGTFAPPATDGLRLGGPGNCLIRGLAVLGFGGDGIEIFAGANHQVAGCFLGIDVDGTTVLGNTGNGVRVTSTATTLDRIGGDSPGDHNLLSGNLNGVSVESSAQNQIHGNLIGTDATGTLDRGNVNSGVLLSGTLATQNLVGSTNPCGRNVISGNGTFVFSDHFGINLVSARSNRVIGNFIGTDAAGSAALGNAGSGVRLSGASFNLIGGSTAAERNLISANGNTGVELEFTSPSNSIAGNFIGTDASGTLDRGNGIYGVLIAGAANNLIGGVGAGNVISGNDNDAVYVAGNTSPNTRILGNFIGVDASGSNALGNLGAGVRLEQSNSQVGGTNANEGNVIAFNGNRGVTVSLGDVGCPILGNSIYSNTSLGIDLSVNGVSANDPGDADSGANNLQNFPALQFALSDTNSTWVTGSLDSGTNQSYRLEFFDNTELDATGFGEGRRFSTATNVTTDANGHADFLVFLNPPPLGNFVTSTATDTNGNTSEFSRGARVVQFDSVDLDLDKSDSPDPASIALGYSYTLTLTNRGPTNATGVVVTDTLPVSVVFVSAVSSQGSCTHTAGVVTCNLGALDFTSNAVITIAVAGTQTGLVTNTAIASAIQLDHATNNNTATETTFLGLTDLAVFILDSPDPVVAGQPLTCIVVISNLGPDVATLANCGFSLDATVVPLSNSISQGSVQQFGNFFSFDAGTIPVGGSATLAVVGIPTVSGVITHSAFAFSAEADPAFGNNNVNENTTVTDGAGVLQFLVTAFSVFENGGQASVIVLRSGGAIGSVAASFLTSDGSATAGPDYSNTVGTLSFTNGEWFKTFSVPIVNDVLFECNEFFNVALHSPTGGVVLIGATQAVVNIIENDLALEGSVKVASGATNNLPDFPGQGDSFKSSVSADGRYVAFASTAGELVTQDNNFDTDVFVRDLLTQTTTLVSFEQSGSFSGNGSSQNGIIGGNGRYVIFDSFANDLVPMDNNGQRDVFLRDLVAETTTLLSVNASGNDSGNGTSFSSDTTRSLISSNGQFIAFTSTATDLVSTPDDNGTTDVFVFDLAGNSNRLVSVSAAGTNSANGVSYDPVVSANGQVVGFASDASSLVANDSNGQSDVFARDLMSGVTELVSLNLAGSASANGPSTTAYLSESGRYVAFHSTATDLATNDTTTLQDVYWRDRVTGVTRLVSANTNGTAAGNSSSQVYGISANGRYVVFASFANNLTPGDNNSSEDVFVRDLLTDTTTLVSVKLAGSAPGNASSSQAVLSADGSHVAFKSFATDLTAVSKNGSITDVFVRDLAGGVTRLVSYRYGSFDGGPGQAYDPAISFNGNVTSFTAEDDTGGGEGSPQQTVQSPQVGSGAKGQVSGKPDTTHPAPDTEDWADGAGGGGSGYSQVWAHNFLANFTELVSVSTPSQTGNGYSYFPVVSRDGRFVAFASSAENLVTNDSNAADDVFVMDLASCVVELVSVDTSGSGNGFSGNPSISSNGNWVGFDSSADNLVAGDNNFTQDVFVRDRAAGSNFLVSFNLAGAGPGNGYSANPALSLDARYVGFESGASDLILADTNNRTDVFLRDRVAGTTTLVSRKRTGAHPPNDSSFDPVVEVNPVSGQVYVAYTSSASDLVANDTNSVQDVFVYDVSAGSNYLVSVNTSGARSGNGFSFNPQLAVDPVSGNVLVAYSSFASDLVNNDANSSEDVFVFDLASGTNRLASVNLAGTGSGNDVSTAPSLSANGRYLVFQSGATDLVTGDTNLQHDIFVRDLVSGTTVLVTMNCAGTGSAAGFSHNPVISADGRYVSYLSSAADLMPGDFVAMNDNVFRYDRLLGETTVVSQNRFLTGGGNGSSFDAQISGNGGTVAFTSYATDLVPTDGNNDQDVFAWQSGVVATPPDLVLNKTASTNSVVECYNFTYTLTLTNLGTGGASGVSVTDILPAGVSFVSAVTSQGSVTNSGNTVTASIGSLAINSGATVTITVTAIAVGSVSNFASATAIEGDANVGDNQDSVVVTVTPLTPPTLFVMLSNNVVVVSWPSSLPNVFSVESTTNLNPVILWSPDTNSISDDGTNRSITITPLPSVPEKFYRLKK